MSDSSEFSGQNVQNEPLLAQNVATDDDKIRGILAQTQADLPGAEPERIREVLIQRLTEAGLPVETIDVDALTREIS